ncbi:S8 family peptidase [Actinoplanes subtropicus]|uniref:S8 family peptidase n=1 Tax=Actinoplanes subtropicus TaxID=543632 RepID=UPI0004C2D210|nr:S8/S53 family peptidase [Actinoplanes subtropicus]
MSATDHATHSQHALVLTGDPDSIKGVGHLNDILRSRGLTSRLAGEFRPAGSSAVIVPVIGGDAGAVVRTLRAEGRRECHLLSAYVDGTFLFFSRGVGHGLTFSEFTPDEGTEPPREWLPVPEKLRRPVVALLDSGVHRHEWLPDAPEDDPFLIDAAADPVDPWKPDLTGDAEAPFRAAQTRAGHGTFIAGIIRQVARSARVLSVRVMNDQGGVHECTVLDALGWLLRYVRRDHPVDVLCMAFGRVPGDRTDQPLQHEIDRLLAELAAEGVQAVASAGNNHQGEEIFPASSASVIGVGAGFGGYHAEFSNFGPWVERYRDGVNVESIMPGGKWARWSGTSFAAANFAADLAIPRVAR